MSDSQLDKLLTIQKLSYADTLTVYGFWSMVNKMMSYFYFFRPDVLVLRYDTCPEHVLSDENRRISKLRQLGYKVIISTVPYDDINAMCNILERHMS